jgi:hypothetical protein
MNVLDTVMIAGLCLSSGACIFLIAVQMRAARQTGATGSPLESNGRSERFELYNFAVWSGFLLVQATNVLHHRQPDGMFLLSLLSLGGFAASVFICGAAAGRVALRREMRSNKPNDTARI